MQESLQEIPSAVISVILHDDDITLTVTLSMINT